MIRLNGGVSVYVTELLTTAITMNHLTFQEEINYT
jgi:hypothetical protein